jgi:hypothetical protein
MEKGKEEGERTEGRGGRENEDFRGRTGRGPRVGGERGWGGGKKRWMKGSWGRGRVRGFGERVRSEKEIVGRKKGKM